jgi:hypothetical protein
VQLKFSEPCNPCVSHAINLISSDDIWGSEIISLA